MSIHEQILKKLAANELVQSIDEDLARLSIKGFLLAKHNKKIANDLVGYILPKILLRWNCVLKADQTEVSEIYKQKIILTLALTLHKYGLTDKKIKEQAIHSINSLNKSVVLSDDFFRNSNKIITLLETKPIPLKRKPKSPDNITFYRPKDVISIQLNKKYYCAYIHNHSRPNESPIIEFYTQIFDKVPSMKEIHKLKAKGQVWNDGTERISKFSVSGMKFSPDLANQIKLIGSNLETPPSNKHLIKPDWEFTGSDIFQFQDDIKRTFEK